MLCKIKMNRFLLDKVRNLTFSQVLSYVDLQFTNCFVTNLSQKGIGMHFLNKCIANET